MNYLDIFLEKTEAQKRFDICKKCDQIKIPLYQCDQCGCFMKIKVKMKNSNCPLDKW